RPRGRRPGRRSPGRGRKPAHIQRSFSVSFRKQHTEFSRPTKSGRRPRSAKPSGLDPLGAAAHVTPSRPLILLKKAPGQGWGGSSDIGADQTTHARASVGDCGPVWPRPSWPRPPRAASYSTVVGVSRFEFLLL